MAWTLNETRTYTFQGASETDSKYTVSDLEDGTYEVVVHGADGGDGDGASDSVGGIGGYIKGTFFVSSSDTLEIWVGEKGDDGVRGGSIATGGWGRNNGGNGTKNGEEVSGAGGGSTEVLLNTNLLAVADAAGGGAASEAFQGEAAGGGGGARGGLAGGGNQCSGCQEVKTPEDGEGTGFGGDGGDGDGSSNNNQPGGDGGQEAGSDLTSETETTGGATQDASGNGYVELTYLGNPASITGITQITGATQINF